MTDHRTLVLRAEDVERFARASGDVNPLHTDVEFSRRTPYGRPIAHGALVVSAALGIVPPELFHRLAGLTARFAGPVVAGGTYEVRYEGLRPGASGNGARADVTVAEGGVRIMSISLDVLDAEQDEALRPRPLGPAAEDATGAARPRLWPEPGTELTGPEVRVIDDIEPGMRVTGQYVVPSARRLRELADRLGADGVPQGLLDLLAWVSYFVGMRLPGRDALFSTLKMRVARPDRRHSAPPTGEQGAPPGYEAAVRAADPLTGGIATDIVIRGGDAAIELETFAFLRARVPAMDRRAATRFLPAGDALAGRNVLVVGGSRGLGAALTGVFAAQGATVWAGYTRHSDAFAALQREFGSTRVRGLMLDATEPKKIERAMRELDAAGTVLDGIVLSAGPSVPSLALHRDTAARTLDFISDSVTMVLHPLVYLMDHIDPAGWVVAISSSAVENTPRNWPHYVAAKYAVEGLVTYYARHTGLRTLIARAPKMWTEMSNSPTARLETVPAEQVASAIAQWAVRAPDPAEDNPLVYSSAELAAWSGPVASAPRGPSASPPL